MDGLTHLAGMPRGYRVPFVRSLSVEDSDSGKDEDERFPMISRRRSKALDFDVRPCGL
jgi:hypothetical protein